jgi:hypothetical protein
VDDLAFAPEVVPLETRPAFLVAQPGNDPKPIIERLASAERLTFVVGAGASMEAGLPSWGRLVRVLLDATAPRSLSERDRAAWLGAVGESGLLGMAATARALAGGDEEFVKLVERHLYRGSPHTSRAGGAARYGVGIEARPSGVRLGKPRPFGYDVQVRQSGRLLARVRKAGRCVERRGSRGIFTECKIARSSDNLR